MRDTKLFQLLKRQWCWHTRYREAVVSEFLKFPVREGAFFLPLYEIFDQSLSNEGATCLLPGAVRVVTVR